MLQQKHISNSALNNCESRLPCQILANGKRVAEGTAGRGRDGAASHVRRQAVAGPEAGTACLGARGKSRGD